MLRLKATACCSGKMVKLTIWGALAENEGAQLETLSHPVLAIAAVRVGDYDGVLLLPDDVANEQVLLQQNLGRLVAV